MNFKKYAKIFGIGFIIGGILGFIPGITHDSKLIGIFHVNTAHNLFHLFTGVIGYWCSRESQKAAQLFLQIFGVVYGVIAVLGFGYGNAPIFGLIANNTADTWLHLAVAILSLDLSFLHKMRKR